VALVGVVGVVAIGPVVSAVTSQIHRLGTAADLLAGKADGVQIDSQGRITLARRHEVIDVGEAFDPADPSTGAVWSINAMVVDEAGAVYLGTSPNGIIFRWAAGQLERLYPKADETPAAEAGAEPPGDQPDAAAGEGAGANPEADGADVGGDPVIRNEHVFAMTIDKAGRLIAGISGRKARLVRFDDGEPRVVFSPREDQYILSLAVDEVGNVYVGTGPHGRIWRLDPFGRNATLVYTCRDKNVLSLTVDAQGRVYAGCDGRGLVYRIDPADGTATVMYDSEQDEVTALVFDEAGNLYAAATTAAAASAEVQFDPIAADTGAGKADAKGGGDSGSSTAETGTKLDVPNTGQAVAGTGGARPAAAKRGTLPKSAGHVYRIDPRGFVTDVFTDMSVFFDMARAGGRLLLATGNEAKLFTIDLATEDKAVLYADEQSAQVTAVAVAAAKGPAGSSAGSLVWLGLANPPRLVRVDGAYASSGTYTSDLIDAGQPARWGTLQLDADLPEGTVVQCAVRSGNVKDPNDPTFSSWSAPTRVTRATALDCPPGRFCQVRLTLTTDRAEATPVVRELAVSQVVDNLAPKVTQVKATRQQAKPGVFQVLWTASDANKDTLIYRLEFRRQGRSGWIELKDELTATAFEWDSRTVEDGRYELRVTADDVRSNTPQTALTASRISDPVVVDNTPPIVEHATSRVEDGHLTLVVGLRDALSALKSLQVTVDSNEDWIGVQPEDGVFDTVAERFTVVLKNLEPGPHVVALKFADHVDNTGYKTLEITVP